MQRPWGHARALLVPAVEFKAKTERNADPRRQQKDSGSDRECPLVRTAECEESCSHIENLSRVRMKSSRRIPTTDKVFPISP